MYRLDFRRYTMKGAVLGFLAFCGLLVLYALLRNTIRKEDDIREKLNLTCAGVVPQVKFKAHREVSKNRIDIANPRTGEFF